MNAKPFSQRAGRTAFRWSRQLHRWAALIAALPLLLTICTGLLLIQRSNFGWIQPKARTGSTRLADPGIQPAEVLTILKTIPEAEVQAWKDVSQVIFNPAKGLYLIRLKNHYEVQIDAASAQVLNVQYRTSTLLIALHEGSWFHPLVMQWVFFPAGVLLLLLWISGIYLWLYPTLTSFLRKPA